MKRSLFFIFAVLALFSMNAQNNSENVSWNYDVKMTSKAEGQINFTATMQNGWHIYGMTMPSEDGPRPTSITLTPGAGIQLVGELTPSTKALSKMDEQFGCKVNYWEGKVTISQKFKLTGKTPKTVAAKLKFMACNDETCMPPKTINFNIEVK